MPVTFDNVAFNTTTGTALQFNLTAASNAVLLVFARGDVAQSVSAMAYGGVALTQLATQDNVNHLWVLTAPASGSNVLSAQWAGAAANFGLIAVTYTNVKTVGPFGTAQATASSGTTIALSLSASTTQLVVIGGGMNSGLTTTYNIGNGTHRGSATGSLGAFLLEVADVVGAATLSVSASSSIIVSHKIIAVPLIFSASAATSFTLAQMGCGV